MKLEELAGELTKLKYQVRTIGEAVLTVRIIHLKR